MSDANIQMHKLDAGIRYHWDIRIQCRYESIQMVIQQIESYSAHSISQSHFAFNRLKSRKSILLYSICLRFFRNCGLIQYLCLNKLKK